MQRVNVKDISPKQDIESVFLVKHIAVMSAKDGKKYLNIIFSDATGDLEARAWHNAEEISEKITKGQFARVKGKGNIFQGRKQFIVSSIEPLEKSEVNLDDFVLKAERPAEDMYIELLGIVKDLDDVYIRDLLNSVLDDKEITRRLKKWQAGKTIHHAYVSGLLEHILSCANLAVTLSPIYGVNVNYVVTGAILHDICKIYELTDDINVEYTEEGKLVGHLVKALEVVDRFSYRVKDFPYQTKLHIKHILLSHHGEYAYGSPKIPQTSEAMLVHLIDLMDSKMHTFETIKRNDNTTGHWSGYVRHLDRIVYKGDLPYYPEYIASDSRAKPNVENNDEEIKTSVKATKSVRVHVQKEIKQNLGDALKDFKVK